MACFAVASGVLAFEEFRKFICRVWNCIGSHCATNVELRILCEGNELLTAERKIEGPKWQCSKQAAIALLVAFSSLYDAFTQ